MLPMLDLTSMKFLNDLLNTSIIQLIPHYHEFSSIFSKSLVMAVLFRVFCEILIKPRAVNKLESLQLITLTATLIGDNVVLRFDKKSKFMFPIKCASVNASF